MPSQDIAEADALGKERGAAKLVSFGSEIRLNDSRPE
jgi:hypothetical protein